MCGKYYSECPKVPNSVRDHTGCFEPKAEVFNCLNRMDKYPDIFLNQSLYIEEPLNLNKLQFEFNDTHLRCRENNWIPWTDDGLDELWLTKFCQSWKEVRGQVLYTLLIRDMGFKGRHLIPVEYLREYQ